MSTENISTFQDLLDISPEKLNSGMQRMREIILDIHPEVIEVVRLGEKSASYGIGPKKMSEAYVYILPYANWFNLGFYYGIELPDPKKLLHGSGKKLRHIKMKSIEDCHREGVRELINNALKERLTFFDK